jgi:hypothetical protein
MQSDLQCLSLRHHILLKQHYFLDSEGREVGIILCLQKSRERNVKKGLQQRSSKITCQRNQMSVKRQTNYRYRRYCKHLHLFQWVS